MIFHSPASQIFSKDVHKNGLSCRLFVKHFSAHSGLSVLKYMRPNNAAAKQADSPYSD